MAVARERSKSIFALVLASLVVAGDARANHGPARLVTPGSGAFDVDSTPYISGDGERLFFETAERLSPQDTDSSVDVYQRSGGATTLMSTGPSGGNGAVDAELNLANPTGTHVFMRTEEKLVPEDDNGVTDVYLRTGGTTTLVSEGVTTNDDFGAIVWEASSDGTKAILQTNDSLASTDTDDAPDLYLWSAGTITHVTTGPGPGPGALPDMNDGPMYLRQVGDFDEIFFNTRERLLASDDDVSGLDVYVWSGGTVEQLSTGTSLGGAPNAGTFNTLVSVDGTNLAFSTTERFAAGDTDSAEDLHDRDRVAGTTAWVSSSPTPGTNTPADDPPVPTGMSDDGSVIYFTTPESLVDEDDDTQRDVYKRSGGVTTLVSVGENGAGNGTFPVLRNAGYTASADGSRYVFHTAEALVPADTDTNVDLYVRAGTTTTLISTGPADVPGGVDAPAASVFTPDGQRGAFVTRERLVAEDSDNSQDVYEWSNGVTSLLSRGPAGGNGSLDALLSGFSTDGDHVFIRTSERLSPCDKDSSADLYAVSDGAGPDLDVTCPAPQPPPASPGTKGGPPASGGRPAPLVVGGCVNADAAAAGKALGPARLGRTQKGQRAIFKGAKLRGRKGLDRYCAVGGGSFRIGYPTKRLMKTAGKRTAKKIKGRVVLIQTSSKRFTVKGKQPGDSGKGLKGTKRKIGRNTWHLFKGRSGTTQLVVVRKGKVVAVGIGDARLTKSKKLTKRFLTAWQLGT